MAKAVHTPEIRADYHDAIPLNRYGLEEELAEAIFFLCSDRASYITGQTLAVDGGFDATGIGLPSLPLIARPALAELLHVDPNTASGNAAVLAWTGYINLGPAVLGGLFGLLGGYLTDRLGRRRVLTWSILLYAFSSVASGVQHEHLDAVRFPLARRLSVCASSSWRRSPGWRSCFREEDQHEKVLGYTQAFSSIGGMLVTTAYWASSHLPAADFLGIELSNTPRGDIP